jgi:hypothetical protein
LLKSSHRDEKAPEKKRGGGRHAPTKIGDAVLVHNPVVQVEDQSYQLVIKLAYTKVPIPNGSEGGVQFV